jgi:hypothetical protein
MTGRNRDLVENESRRNTWRVLLTIFIVFLCLPSSSMALIWLVRFFLKGGPDRNLFFGLAYAVFLVSSVFGPFFWALACVLWLLQTRMGLRRASVAVSLIFLIFALIGMIAGPSAMR